MRKLALTEEDVAAALEAQPDCVCGLFWCDLPAARTIAGWSGAAWSF
jgi:hypothetical protein